MMILVTSSLLETLGNLSSGAAASSTGLEGIFLGDEQGCLTSLLKKRQTSFTRTLNWIPSQGCPYHRGSRGLYEGGLLGTKRTVCKTDIRIKI